MDARSALPPSTVPTSDLTTSPLTAHDTQFVEEARGRGELYIQQPYELYSAENHEAWRRLYERMRPRWEEYANDHFLAGIRSLCLDPKRIPRLDDVNGFLGPLTGFTARAVSGYVPAFLFFDCLRNREFPTTVTIRRSDQLDYLPEPDIFHDVAGHVPMHTDPQFAEALIRFGECAHTAVDVVREIKDESERVRSLTSIIKAMAGFFWFTIEFGLMRSPASSGWTGSGKDLRVYGSGLLSSYGEIRHAVESPEVQRYPIRIEWTVNQGFEINRYQPLLFIVDSFDHLFSLVDRLEQWMQQGKLSHVAPGEPEIDQRDLKSFLDVTD